MSKNIDKSLCVPRMNKIYTEEKIIYIFWKFCIGKVDRVDFEPIINEETGQEDSKFQKAFIYMSNEINSWNFEQLQYNEKEGSYTLYPYRVPYKIYANNINTNSSENDNDNDNMMLNKNPSPIPYANTTMNVHQLHHKNVLLEKKIQDLEQKITDLPN